MHRNLWNAGKALVRTTDKKYSVMFHMENCLFVSTQVKLSNLYNHFNDGI